MSLGCQTAQRQSAFMPPAKAQAPVLIVSAPPNTDKQQAVPKTPEPEQKTEAAKILAVDAVGDLISRVEKEYLAGQENYRAGHLAAAKQNFDAAFNLLLGSGFDLQSDDRLQAELNRILDGTNSTELEALQLGDGFSEQKSEPAPIDEANEVTPPVDQNVKAKAEAEIKSTHSDLPLMMTDQVAAYINYFSTRGRGTFERALARSGRYEEMIRRTFREEGVPQDLIYLAQAESGFHPLAVSRAGARGMWQFMAGRGSSYGLERSWWTDDRQDPEKATRAAAHHLRDLYNEFGDWYLAMAAYNSGPGTVQAAVKRTGYADFWELYRRNVLPQETRNYVPIILAVTIMAKNPDQYGVAGLVKDKPIPYDTVKIDYPIDLRLVAECVDSSAADLQDMNPSLLRLTTPKDQRFELHLPAGTAEQFQSVVALIPVDKRVWWRYHKVQAGETLTSVARTYHSSPQSIAEANDLDENALTLVLPRETRLIIPIAPSTSKESDTTTYAHAITRYKVRKGDTVESVAKNFGVSEAMIRKWNRLKGNSLVGRKSLLVHVPVRAGAREPKVGSKSPAHHATLHRASLVLTSSVRAPPEQGSSGQASSGQGSASEHATPPSATSSHASPPHSTPSSTASSSTVPPNVVLITIDTTRADRMGFLGSERGLTPNLDSLARQSVVFTRAYSQVPLTAPSHATILTGTYPQFHQVNNFGVPLAKTLPYAPALLRAHGYHTAAFVGALVLDPKARSVPGFERGFDTYDAGFTQMPPGGDRYHTAERRGDVVVAHALAWLKQHPHGPFFIWVHLYDPHDPYDPPEPYKSRYKSAPYDGEIAYADSAVGKLLSELRTRGVYENSVIAVMSDHGEALGDHGEDTHGIFLYDETIHVPLLFKLPGELSAGERVDGRVGLVDVLPTILQAAGIAIPEEVQGKPLLDMVKAMPADRPMYAESDYAYTSFRWSPLRALRTGKYLFVEAPRRELYDQGTDPQAKSNLAPASKAVADTLEGQLDAFRQKTSNSREAPTVSLDEDQQAKLASLGYFADNAPAGGKSSSTNPTGTDPKSVDPKDRVEISNTLHRVQLLVQALHYDEAVALLEQVIQKEPEQFIAYRQLGQIYMLRHDFKKAVPVLRKAVELRPDSMKDHFQLAMALYETGEFAASVPEFEKVVALAPTWEQAHLFLATAYIKVDRAREAIFECDKVLKVAPENYGALLLGGRALVLAKHPEAALPKLKKAATILPRESDPHMAMADAYSQLGRATDAARERAEGQRLAASLPQ
ncbi:MAG: sulfatase-like hydrolase/transferase [Terriglobales bacterium]